MASVYKIIHPQNPALANQQLITAFFKAKRRPEIRIPSVQQLETWDLEIMTRYIRKTMPSSQTLFLYTLQHKTILLLGIATMGRTRSDLERLQHQESSIQSVT